MGCSSRIWSATTSEQTHLPHVRTRNFTVTLVRGFVLDPFCAHMTLRCSSARGHGSAPLPVSWLSGTSHRKSHKKDRSLVDWCLFVVRPPVPFHKMTSDMQVHILQLKGVVTTWKETRPKTLRSGSL